MALNVGVNVVEVDGRANPTIQPAPTSVAAFIGITERGVPNSPTRISSPQQFRHQFGNYRSDSYLAYAVEGFFLNGGQNAYVSRIVGTGSVAATLFLNNRQITATRVLHVAAGSLGKEEPGLWGERLGLDVRDDPLIVTTLQNNIAAGATSAQLQSVQGFQVGSIVRISDGTNTAYLTITAVNASSQTISWSDTSPLASAFGKDKTLVTSPEFRIVVYYRALPGANATVVEQWPNLSMDADADNYVVNTINSQFTGSRYITVTDISGALSGGDKIPAVAHNQMLTSSIENAPTAIDYIGDAATKTGFFAFDTTQIQLLAAPDVHTLALPTRRQIVQQALAYCAERNDCMFVGSTPDRGSNVSMTQAQSDYNQTESDYLNNTIATYASTLQAKKVFGALYAPWIQVFDPVGVGTSPTRFIPPEGHVMGIYARIEQTRGIWKAPAGNEAQVIGALDISTNFTDSQHTFMVRNSLVNGIRQLPGQGIVVAASRTLSTDTRWWFVNVRLLFNFVISSLLIGLRFVRQEPNTEALRASVRLNVVRPFLLGLWQQGAFGSDPPDQVFSIKCDAQNNPPSEVDLGNFKIEVYFYPVRPVETIVIIVGQQPSGGSAKEG